ncbi:hypothetical protein Tco_0990463 [Tanacetum coccineum]|uniref:Uncharacterized protein n=1 Tax=Tanacetum coccineum TaxID=301880 RepID=A0ABQ5EWX2_9ASTR
MTSLCSNNIKESLSLKHGLVNAVTRQTIDQSAGGKLYDRNAKESWALLEDLALYDNKIVILRKEDEVREEENVKPNATEYDDHEMTAKAKERLRKKAKMSLRKRSKKKKRRKRRT